MEIITIIYYTMKHKYPRLLSVLCALMIATSASWAERVSQEDAALVAGNFMNAGDTTSQGAQSPGRFRPLRRVALAEDAQYYVYANTNGEGWVMVAANDVVQPILAYSKQGVFNPDTQPSNVKVWLGGYNNQIKFAEQNNVEATEEVKAKWNSLRKAPPVTAAGTVVVAPLIKTTWDQDDPYWKYCPSSGSSKTYTGCVATAMAQVMNYWQWPVTGTGSYSYTSETNKLACSADFANTTYDWANMVNHYTKYYSGSSQVSVSTPTNAQKEAVAVLMYHCGVAVKMDYGTSSQGGSSAYTIYPNSSYTTTRCAAYALLNNFGYNKSTLKCYYRSGGYGYSSVTDANWLNLLKTELDAKRPIMYAGADDEGGHSFVCDGYDSQNYFHFNWGWSGYCDGYYTVDNMVPGTGGSGSGNGSYNDGQDIIIGIQPPVTGHQVVVSGTGCTITPSLARVENGNQLTATITPTDATYDFTSITVKLGSTTLTRTTHYTLSADNKTLTVKPSAITGDASNNLTITCVWTKNRYSYSLLGTNCTEELEGMVSKNAALSLTITPDAGYTLADPSCWTVEMGSTMLTYGTGFTYNSTANTFNISSVTGDVTILAEAGRPITWRANGNIHATNLTADDKIILPTDPEDCESGKKFVGWCTSSNYSNVTTAPTFAKDGDNYSVATYYAVYATESTSEGGSPVTIIERMSSSSPYVAQTGWTASAGGAYTSAGNYGESSPSVKFSSTGNYIQSAKMDGAITAVSYWYKPQSATGSIDFYVSTDGSTFAEIPAEKVEFSGSSTAATKSITLSASSNYHAIKIVYTKTSSNVAVDDVSITYGGSSTTYSDYSTACGTPCSNTPVMSFENATVNKTTADANYTQSVTITGKGSGQTVSYTSSNTAVGTVASNGTVTLKGVVGSTTITASVDASGIYCAASASYTINVTAAPINVTLFYNNTSATISNQTNPYTLPTGSPYSTAMCDGDWTFDGWCGSAYEKSETKPDYITQLTATGSAYAVYKTTETSSGTPARKATMGTSEVASVTFLTTSTTSDDGTDNSGAIATKLVDQATGISSYSGSKLYKGKSGTGLKMGGSSATGYIVLTLSSTVSVKSVNINASKYGSDTGKLKVTIGSTEIDSKDPASNLSFTATNAISTNTIKVETTTKRAYVSSITVIAEDGGSDPTPVTTTYYATTPDCEIACTLTGIMLNTASVTTTFPQNGEFNSTGLVVTANYSDCATSTVTPTSVSTPDLSSAGNKTVTVSYTENGTTKTAIYTINVVAPKTVTYMVCGDVFTTQDYAPGAALVLPENPGGYDGLTFAGWTTTEHYTGASAPAFISAGGAVNADVTYYAVFH